MNHPARAIEEGLDDFSVSDNYGTRGGRRRQVLALYGGYAAIIPTYAIGYVMIAHHGKSGVASAVVTLALLLLFFGIFAYGFYSLLRNTFVNAPNIRDEHLDERWIERRNRATNLSFRAIAIGLAVAALYVEIALSATSWEWMRDPYLVSWFAWLGALLGVTLPTTIMAWSEPDPLTSRDA